MSDESDVDLSWMLGTGIVGEDEVIPIEESLSRAQNLPDVVASGSYIFSLLRKLSPFFILVAC